MTRILVVEDEAPLARTVKELLEEEGYETSHAGSAEEALEAVRRTPPDLMLLDVRLPGMSGFDLCRKLSEDREAPLFPVIFVTSKSEEPHRVTGLTIGADDYVVKPFSGPELLARIKAVLRRRGATERGEAVLKAGPLTVSPPSHSALLGDKELGLPRKEFALLCAFLTKKKKVLSRAFLMETVWGQEYVNTSRTVDTHVRRLREHLGPLRDCVKTVEGMGYKWEDPA